MNKETTFLHLCNRHMLLKLIMHNIYACIKVQKCKDKCCGVKAY